MKAPDQIDAMIENEARDHDGYARQAQSSVDLHARRARELREAVGCEHAPERVALTDFWKCRRCGYQWKEATK